MNSGTEKKCKKESVSDFGSCLSRLVNRACGDMPRDARKTIVVKQFIHGLDGFSTHALTNQEHFWHSSISARTTGSFKNEHHAKCQK